MYTFKVRTEKEPYKKYNGEPCLVCRNPFRHDGFIEVYLPNVGEFILLRPSELED
mgnify:CR=1 FL=1